MSTLEKTARERQLEGICESQRAELQEAREALCQRAAHGEVQAGERGPDGQSRSGRAELKAEKHTTCDAINGYVAEHLAAIDDMVRGLQAATATFGGRPLDWTDVASLGRVREHLSGAVKGFNSSQAAAQVSRAAREVAGEVLQFRGVKQPNR